MAPSPLEKLKSIWNSQVMDEEQWALNYGNCLKARFWRTRKLVY